MLILTEKSSVANDFALALNCPKRTGYYSNGKIEIAYCVGHLFKLQDPEFYEARFKSWNEIPCIPKQFCYAINETVSKQAHIVLELLKKHKDDEILIATDADREGEIIARECLKLSGISDFHKIKRFWVSQALTPDVILNGIKSARKLYEYNNLAQNGFARQHADWLVGMNLTRYVSVAANKKLSIGRVKTALLSAIENRCSKIENFKSEKYYEFYASFGAKRFAPECKGIYFEPDDKTKFNNNELSQELKKDIEQKTLVIENKTEKKETHAPQLYNLNALQKDAFKYFNISADETLKIIQKLYESYKCVSYPRTPSKVMGNENVELVKQIFLDLSKIYPDFYDVLQISDISLSNKRCFNDSKLEAHHAIIPLENIPHSASDNEKKIFSLILNRFKIAFSAPYIYNKQIVILSVNNHKYKITGNQTLEYGWKKFHWSETFRSNECEEQENEQSLENIDWNNLLCTDVETKEKYTKPPKYFNEASILAFMENPTSIDENTTKLIGLGTPATRHTFIPELIANGYIKIEKKNILITQLGKIVINAIRNSSIKIFANIEETTNWEKKLEDNPEQFENEIKSFIKKSVQEKFLIELKEDNNSEEPICPICKKPLRLGTTKTGIKNWYCSGYSQGCSFKIWEMFNGIKLSKKDVILLCSRKKTSLKTFTSKKNGNEYKAKLYLDTDNIIKFDFN
ncbi:MAG: DNA topoisomerase [Treponema sp.]|nr:DNA topoisomerase [Treponema sp.]